MVFRRLIAVSVFFAFVVLSTASFCSDLDVRLVDARDVEDFCGTRNVKVAFINTGSLYYVDFSETNPAVHQIDAVSDAAIPVISPDGEYIAYATGTTSDAATSGSSTAWIVAMSESAEPVMVSEQGSGYVPRFVPHSIDPLEVLFATCAEPLQGKDFIWDGCGKVVAREIVNGQPGQERDIYAGGSYLGGISYAEDYLGTAENSKNSFVLKIDEAPPQQTLFHALNCKKNSTDEDTLINLQTCNPSMSSSSVYTDCLMYLDFGSGSIALNDAYHPETGSAWGVHTRIFLGRATDDLDITRFYDVPGEEVVTDPADKVGEGEVVGKQWNFPEWSNHPYFAAANEEMDRLFAPETGIMWEHTNNAEQIVAINLKDSLYLRLVSTRDTGRGSTTNMVFPSLFVEKTAGFAEDTTWLGRPNVSIKNKFFRNGNGYVSLSDILSGTPGDAVSLSIYTLNGRMVRAIDLTKGTMPVLNDLHTQGVSLIRITAKNGVLSTHRIIRP
ncbi:MAG: hypothetical protein GF350_02405 [Chitinivibrionales bacterium]|nr:hypothetical protein [Chitinivibrionales bacterium]